MLSVRHTLRIPILSLISTVPQPISIHVTPRYCVFVVKSTDLPRSGPAYSGALTLPAPTL